MVLWWIGIAVLLLVVAPVVVVLLQRVNARIDEIQGHAGAILEHGVAVASDLDAVPNLVETRQLTSTAVGVVGQYGAALQRLL
jgi:hypothetical protein